MTIRTHTARLLRRFAGWNRAPLPFARLATRLAFEVSPHSLTCKLCGARFVQPAPGSTAHARQAFDHSDVVHAHGVATKDHADGSAK